MKLFFCIFFLLFTINTKVVATEHFTITSSPQLASAAVEEGVVPGEKVKKLPREKAKKEKKSRKKSKLSDGKRVKFSSILFWLYALLALAGAFALIVYIFPIIHFEAATIFLAIVLGLLLFIVPMFPLRIQKIWENNNLQSRIALIIITAIHILGGLYMLVSAYNLFLFPAYVGFGGLLVWMGLGLLIFGLIMLITLLSSNLLKPKKNRGASFKNIWLRDVLWVFFYATLFSCYGLGFLFFEFPILLISIILILAIGFFFLLRFKQSLPKIKMRNLKVGPIGIIAYVLGLIFAASSFPWLLIVFFNGISLPASALAISIWGLAALLIVLLILFIIEIQLQKKKKAD